MSNVRIDCAQIPRIEVKILCHTLVSAAERFYDDPENRRRFEEWQRKGRLAVTVLGVLAIPVVLSVIYSWYWMFLYIGYLVVILYVALYCVRYDVDREGGTRK